MDFGFHEIGMEPGLIVETDEAARKTYSINLDVEPRAEPVESICWNELAGLDVVVAGPPCQGFSSLGSRDPSDTRNAVLDSVVALICAIRPRGFVIENVMGLQNLHKGLLIKGVFEALERANLAPQVFRLSCADFGVPQHRKRLVVAGGRGDFSHRLRALLKPTGRTTVGEVLLPSEDLEGLPNHEGRKTRADWYDTVMSAIGPGQKLCDTRLGHTAVHSWDIPSVFGPVSDEERELLHAIARKRRSTANRRWKSIGDGKPVRIECLARHLNVTETAVRNTTKSLEARGFLRRGEADDVDLARRFNGRFRRLDPSGLAPAVTKDFGSPRAVVHPTENRGLTPRECARLQTFPDSYVFAGSLEAQYKMIANAFPPKASQSLAKAVAAALGEQ